MFPAPRESSLPSQTLSMAGLWNTSATGAYKEIEIHAAVSLQDVVIVEPAVAATRRWLWRLPSLAPARDLRLRHVEMKPPSGYVELDRVSILNYRQHSAGRRFGRNMQDHRAIGCAAHAGV